MRKLLNLVIGFVALTASSSAFAYGEGGDIPSDSRAMHLLVNEARSDVQFALSKCGSNCTEGTSKYGSQVTPVWWNDDLHRAAQFHSTMLASVGSCLEHHSLCTLKNDLSGCDGSPSCACTTGKASCSGSGTATFDRVGRFANNASGEIIFNGSLKGDSFTAFYSYLHEDGNITSGHRAIILDGNSKSVGFGDKLDSKGTDWDTGDFGSVATSNSAITSGAYYTASSRFAEYNRVGNGKLWFKMHYYASSPIQKATLSLNGQCTQLNAVVGNTKNGVYGMSPANKPAKCAEYFYEAIDQSGKITRFPTTGVLVYDCNVSWKASSNAQSCLSASTANSAAQPATATPVQPNDQIIIDAKPSAAVETVTVQPTQNNNSGATVGANPNHTKNETIVIDLPTDLDSYGTASPSYYEVEPSNSYGSDSSYNCGDAYGSDNSYNDDDWYNYGSGNHSYNSNSNSYNNGGNAGSSSRSESTTVEIRNGQRITTTKIYENGQLVSETVTTESIGY